MIGILVNYPSPPATSLIAFGLINGAFAFITCAFGVHVLRYSGIVPDENS